MSNEYSKYSSKYYYAVYHHFPTLTSVLKMLPNVAPNKTKKKIFDCVFYYDGCDPSFVDLFSTEELGERDGANKTYFIGETALSYEQVCEISISEYSFYYSSIKNRCSPIGAKILKQLYLRKQVINLLWKLQK